MLTDDVRELLDTAVLCWLATADKDGNPSVSPKEMFLASSATEVLIADIASPRSSRNIQTRPHVCVSVVDVFDQHGYQIYGTATVLSEGSEGFAEAAAPLQQMAGPDFPLKGVIRVTVTKVARILAPSLWMYPDVPAAACREQVLRNYGVTDVATD